MVPDHDGLILAGDVGGTNARFAAFVVGGNPRAPVFERTLPSRSGASFLDVLRAVVPLVPGRVAAASFGVAGPVRDGVCRATNLPWVVDSAEVARELGLPSVGLLNDLEASAFGIEVLDPSDLLTLRSGTIEPAGPTALVSAGTGLGVAGTFVIDGLRRPFACEGGHTSFAPTNEREVRLWRRLTAVHGRVSWERVLSGPGLVAVYEFVRDEEGSADALPVAQSKGTDRYGHAIVEAGSNGSSPTADRALEFWASLYGSKAGDTALEFFARGGVYLGGGIPPHVCKWLAMPAFVEAFLAKGRLRPVVEAMPVRVVLESRAALFGAAQHACARATAS